LNVETNANTGIALYGDYKASIDPVTGIGKYSLEYGQGKSAKSQNKNLTLANKLLEQMGVEGMRQFLETPFTVKQLRDAGYDIGSELEDEPVLGSLVFGPKIGFGFFSNLMGNFDPVTMDMWFMRTIGRLTGNLKAFKPEKYADQVVRLQAALREEPQDNGIYADQMPKALVKRVLAGNPRQSTVAALVAEILRKHEKDFKKNREAYDEGTRVKSEMVFAADTIDTSLYSPIDVPSSGSERRYLRDVVRQAVAMTNSITGLKIPNAAFQALIWYPEQELYKALGVKLTVTSQDYAGATAKALLRRGITNEQLERAIADAELRSRRANETRSMDRGQERSGTTSLGEVVKSTSPELAPAADETQAMMSMRRGLAGVRDEGVLRYIDKYDELRRYVDKAQSMGGAIPPVSNPYIGARLLTGKLGAMQAAAERTYADLLRRMHVAGVRLEDMDEFLYAQHAEERNTYIASINPLFPDAGSGMATLDANNLIQRYRNNGQFAMMNGFADEWRNLLQEGLNQRQQSGLISAQTRNILQTRYKNYVPLRGAPAQLNDEDFLDFAAGAGGSLSTTGPGIPQAMGRRSAAEAVTSQIGFVHEDSFRASAKNDIGRSFLQLVMTLGDRNVAEVILPRRRVISGKQVRVTHDPAWMNDDRNFGVYTNTPMTINGHDYEPGDLVVIRINNRRLAESMTQPTLELRSFERALRFVNNGWRFMTTGMGNPTFAPVNLVRDAMTASLANASANGIRDTAQMLSRWPSSFYNVFRDSWNGSEPTGDYARFVRAGADQLYWSPNDLDVKRTDFDALAARVQRRDPRDRGIARTLLGWYPAFFSASETAVRLANYRQRIATGSRPQEAALSARDLTVDFAKGGKAKPVLNTWYMFLNAGLQGNVNVLRALGRSVALAPSLLMLGFANAALARLMGGDDEETGQPNWDNIPEYEKTSNLFFFDPRGTGKHIKIPLPYGFNVLVSIGGRMADAMFGRTTAGDVLAGSLNDALNAFNPMGGSGIKSGGASLVAAAMPTMTRPAIELLANQDFSGRSIYPKSYEKYAAPDSTMSFDGTPAAWQELATFVNSATGGDEFTSGMVDVSPNTLQYLAGYYFSGTGRTLDRLYKTFLSNEDVSVSDVPFVRSFVGDAKQDGRAVSQAFYTEQERLAPIRRKIDAVLDESRPIEERRAIASEITATDYALARSMEESERVLKEIRNVLKQATPEQREAILEVRRKMLKATIKKQNELTDRLADVE
jgi:hypothetical protein